jgi:hypothetical protein
MRQRFPNVDDSIPKLFGDTPSPADTAGHAWDPWDKATWHERLKAGVDQYREAVIDVTSR